MPDSDEKYITFKREELMQMVGRWSSEHMLGTTNVPRLLDDVDRIAIPDAVVIRRQDYYASPALAGYAASIAIAVKTTDDDKKRNQLMEVSDYFQRQSELAADEGWKLPDV